MVLRQEGRRYRPEVASNVMETVIQNYKSYNVMNDRLRVAQIAFRNAILLLLVAALLLVATQLFAGGGESPPCPVESEASPTVCSEASDT